MGYTHYYNNDKVIAKTKWSKLTKDVKKLISHLNKDKPLLQKEYDNSDEPVIDGNEIRYNGIGDAGHETFLLRRKGQDWSFCKTAHKPYDLAVCATLILYSYHCGEKFANIGSDGSLENEEWQSAVSLIKELFKDIKFKMPRQS